MITSVNEDRRHAEMPNLQAQHDLELRQLANNAEADKRAVLADLEAELERLEPAGPRVPS